MNSIIYICFASIILLNTCSKKDSSIDNGLKKQVVFGNGGGFTGQINEYILFENGDLFLNNPVKQESKIIKTLTKTETKDIFEKIISLNLDKNQFIHPGNLYYFVKFLSNGKIYEVTWGDNKFLVPPEVKEFYNFLMSKTK